jgi:hypothetical protein
MEEGAMAKRGFFQLSVRWILLGAVFLIFLTQCADLIRKIQSKPIQYRTWSLVPVLAGQLLLDLVGALRDRADGALDRFGVHGRERQVVEHHEVIDAADAADGDGAVEELCVQPQCESVVAVVGRTARAVDV